MQYKVIVEVPEINRIMELSKTVQYHADALIDTIRQLQYTVVGANIYLQANGDQKESTETMDGEDADTIS
ncbi:MAG: hypothetical protein FWG88_05185 [Oscillospiraceae bacterium]|nr:hypothetical protein [Oscillospiraceae bacterium]